MGAEVCRAVSAADDLTLAAQLDVNDPLADLLGVDVVVDFTHPDAVMDNVEFAIANGIHAVVGTTGFDDDDINTFRRAFSGSNCLIASNFAVSAVLMMRFAELAAKWFDTVEIIELHHDAKVDAPSGTAITTAERIAAASTEWSPDPTQHQVFSGARGGVGPGGIHIHSVRMRGMVAHQEVILGSLGQTLTIRQDSYDRSSYMPGVVLACRHVAEHPGLTLGLERILEV